MARRCTIYNHIDKHISDKIKTERIFRGLSRKDVCNSIHVSQQQLLKYEKNQNRISASRLLMLSKFFDLNIYDFFHENDVAYTKIFDDNINIRIVKKLAEIDCNKTKNTIFNLLNDIVKNKPSI